MGGFESLFAVSFGPWVGIASLAALAVLWVLIERSERR